MTFCAEMSDINFIHNILKSVPSGEHAIIRPMEEGVKVIVENSKNSEISIYLPAELFSQFMVNAESDMMFKIHMKRFIDCLHIFGDEGNPSMKLSYQENDGKFILIMKHSEENINVTCEFATMSVDEYQEVYLFEECNVNTIIFNGEAFVDALSDLDPCSDDYEIMIKTDPPAFKLSASSILGESKMLITKDSSSIAVFNCKEDFQARYDFSTLRNIMKVMMLAQKISLGTGNTGLMGLNMIIQQDDRRVHIEYFFTAQFEDDD